MSVADDVAVLALDQGTTSTRAVLCRGIGTVDVVDSVTHRQHYPSAGRVEHDPLELLANLQRCLDATAARAPVAVGLANQGESCLGWHAETGEPVSPVIVWQDDRTAPTIDALRAAGAADEVRRRAGLPLDSYFSASKLAWIAREIPAAKRLAAQGKLRLGTTDAFFRERLSGRFETDVATASRTSLLNLDALAWDPELCRLFEVPIDALPAIGPTAGNLGHVRIGGQSVPFTGSLVDQQAALYGHGCRVAGETKMTFGTGAFALTLVDRRPDVDIDALPTVAWQVADAPPVFALDGGIYVAAAAINWARSLGLFDEFATLDALTPPAAATERVVFVPALSGLGCPHWDRRARGAWFGLALEHERDTLLKAVLEGVAFRMAEVVETIASTQALTDPISVDGGMSANRYFCQFLADVLQRRLHVTADREITAFGTAAMAADGLGAAWPNKRPAGHRVDPQRHYARERATFASARTAVQTFGAP